MKASPLTMNNVTTYPNLRVMSWSIFNLKGTGIGGLLADRWYN